MSTTLIRSRWADKFHEPTSEELLAGSADRGIVSYVREHLTAAPQSREAIEWLGTPWRWTFVYSCETDPTRALAYVVPDPARTQVCVPLTMEMLQAIPLRRLKKVVREGIMYSKVVAGTFWPAWDVGSRAIADEVLDLAGRKLKYVQAGQESLAGV